MSGHYPDLGESVVGQYLKTGRQILLLGFEVLGASSGLPTVNEIKLAQSGWASYGLY